MFTPEQLTEDGPAVLDKLMDSVKGFADSLITKGIDRIAAQVFISSRTMESKDEEIDVLLLALDEGKREALHAYGLDMFTKQRVPIATVLMMEGWASQKLDMRPSEDPDRTETLQVIGMSLPKLDVAKGFIRSISTKSGRIVPSEPWKLGDKIESPLLRQFWHGYFQTVRAKNAKHGRVPGGDSKSATRR